MLDEGVDLGLASIHGLLTGGQSLPSAAERNLIVPRASCPQQGIWALVERIDDAVFAGCANVVVGP